jgi:hypothetical protein
MNLYDYFENTEGRGVLATADSQGKVDVAIYSRPHVMEDGSIAFIMRDRLSHKNLESNPHAAFLFIEKDKLDGKRFFLTKIKEVDDMDQIKALRRRKKYTDDGEPIFLVYFTIDKELPLIGAGEK